MLTLALCHCTQLLTHSIRSSSLKRETTVQTVEIQRLEGSLCELKQQLVAANQNYEVSERQRKKLTEDFVHAEEELSKLQGTCEELLREKGTLNDKIAAMNEVSINVRDCN